MKIVFLTPGSGDNFYCENCLRDAQVVKTIRSIGHDVIMVPMYLPLQVDKFEKVSNAPVFFGGINVYLQQKSNLFRNSPRWLDKIFDSKPLLEMAGKRAGMVDAKQLGETAVSMLLGKEGKQKKELDRLADWLSRPENRPDVICLSNVLLAGVAEALKKNTKSAIACLLQDEDEFFDSLNEPHLTQVKNLLRQRTKDIDMFIAVSDYYAQFMKKQLDISDQKINVVYTGIDVDSYNLTKPENKNTIGFLSRMCPSKGLDILADAFIQLKAQNRFKNLKLKAAGGLTAADKNYLKNITQKISDAGIGSDVEFIADYNVNLRKDFLNQVSLMCVPEKRPPAYGLYVLEALAAGLPTVIPATGIFSEIKKICPEPVRLYHPNKPDVLAKTLQDILTSDEIFNKMKNNARSSVIEAFDIRKSAEKYIQLFQSAANL